MSVFVSSVSGATSGTSTFGTFVSFNETGSDT